MVDWQAVVSHVRWCMCYKRDGRVQTVCAKRFVWGTPAAGFGGHLWAEVARSYDGQTDVHVRARRQNVRQKARQSLLCRCARASRRSVVRPDAQSSRSLDVFLVCAAFVRPMREQEHRKPKPRSGSGRFTVVVDRPRFAGRGEDTESAGAESSHIYICLSC